MITREEFEEARRRAAGLMREAGLPLSDEELERIEVADFGLGRLEHEGAQILTLVQTARFGVKLIALFPGQSLPEHWHPPVGDDPGKEETVRMVSGRMFIYRTGPDTVTEGFVPAGKEGVYTLRSETVALPPDQCTFTPGEKHWFQGGPEGAVAFSFSTVARDILDRFTDPAVERHTVIADGPQTGHTRTEKK